MAELRRRIAPQNCRAPPPDVYAYADSAAIPLASTHLNALSISPPEQPLSVVSHCTRSSSDSESSVPDEIWYAPSSEPVVEKAQQLPQRPWFFTGVTAPAVTQSTASGSAAFEVTWSDVAAGFAFLASKPGLKWSVQKSSFERSEYSLWPSLYARFFALCEAMMSSFSENALNACASAAAES